MPIPQLEASIVATNPARPGTVYLAGIGVWKSTDAGVTWYALKRMPGGLTLDLVIDPYSSRTLYATTLSSQPRRAFKSTDGGKSWSAASRGIPVRTAVWALEPDPLRGALLAATRRGVFLTRNGAKEWVALNQGLPPGLGVLSILVLPQRPDTFLAGTEGGGIYSYTRVTR